MKRRESMRAALIKMLPLFLLWLTGSTAFAQDYVYGTGAPTFTIADPVEMGFVNVANGNTHLEIPITSAPQRGSLPFSAKLVYDSRIWKIVAGTWQPTNAAQGGWRLMTSAATGSVNYTATTEICNLDPPLKRETFYDNFTWTAPDGTQHTFFGILTDNTGAGQACGPSAPNSDALADDSSGYHMYVTNYTTATVFAPDGTQVYPTVKDTNGNYFSADANGNPIDTLGRTPLIKTVSGNLTYYDLLDSRNSSPRPRITVTTATINVNTNFGQSGITEYSGTITVIQSIALPDGTSYVFDYDSGTTPGNFGLLKTMTLPTGGQVSYSQTTYADSYANRNRWLASRTSEGGTWACTPVVITTCPLGGTGCQQKVTITAPSADDVVHTFTLNNGAWGAQAQHYAGYASTGTLLKTVATDYDFSNSCPLGTCTGARYIRTVRSTTSLQSAGGATLTKKTEYTYDSVSRGNVTAVKEWKYYTGTPAVSPDRETDYTYLATTSYLNKNILNRVSSETTKNSAGTQIAQTNYTYDSTALTSITGVTQHDDTNFGTGNTVRGNRTLVQRWVSGTTYLTTTNFYDTTGQLRQVNDPKGNVTTYSYTDSVFHDDGGNPPLAYAPPSPTNAYLTQVALPVSGIQSFGYYFNTGKRAFSKDQNNADTYEHYLDPLDRLTHRYQPLTNGNRGWTLVQYTTATQRDEFSGINDAIPSSSCSSCRHDQFTYDGLGRLTKKTLVNDPEGATIAERSFDSTGRVQAIKNPYRSISDPTYGTETYSFDGLDRVTGITRADGSSASTSYGPAVSGAGGASAQLCSSGTYGLGYPTLFVDEAGKKRQTWEDGFGKIIEADEPDANNNLTLGTCYQYNLLGNLTQVVQASQTRTYTYDGLGRQTAVTTPESGTTNFYYTTSTGALCSGTPGAVCRRTDARAITATYGYDALNRPTSTSYSDTTPAVSFFYDQTTYNGLTITNGLGRRTGMSDGSGSTAWSYDPAGQVLTVRRAISGVTKSINYSYNLGGSVATIGYPSGRTITYAYSAANRPVSVIDSANAINYALNAVYAPHGALSSVVHGQVTGGFAGITESYTYNNRTEVSTIRATSSNGTALDLAYSFNLGTTNNGDVYSVTDNVSPGRSQTFTYDELNRIKTAQSQATSGTDCWGQSYGYDRYGNLLSATVTKCSVPALSLSVNANNRITNTGFSYDVAGNMTNDGSFTYSFDAENRQTFAAGVTYTYDGDGWRVKKSSGTLYWYGLQGEVLLETDLSGVQLNEYVFFVGRRIARRTAAGAVQYFFSDYLGSTRALTDASGNPLQKLDYYPFGGAMLLLNATANQYQFVGRERDSETGLDYYQYRMLATGLGRWTAGDRILLPNPGFPQMLDRYTYVLDNPTNYLDPDGRCARCPGDPGWRPGLQSELGDDFREGRRRISICAALPTWMFPEPPCKLRLTASVIPPPCDGRESKAFAHLSGTTDQVLISSIRVTASTKGSARITVEPQPQGGLNYFLWEMFFEAWKSKNGGTIKMKVEYKCLSGEKGDPSADSRTVCKK